MGKYFSDKEIRDQQAEEESLRQRLNELAIDWQVLHQQLASLKAELKAIGEAINDPRTDLTMTMSEVIVEQKQQLAAALVAIKLKDSLLEQLIAQYSDPVKAEYEKILAIQPDDSALKVWLGEPVAWARYPRFTGSLQTPITVFKEPEGADWVPLYSPKELK
jgi:chromosome segregation ATPase